MLPQISLGTAILLIFLMCAGFMFIRGITRMLVGSICLALSAWVAFLAWQHAPELSVRYLDKSVTAINYGLPILAFLVVFLLLRFILMFLSKPLGMDKPPGKFKGNFFPRILLALVPTAVICFIAAVVVYHFGSVAEVSYAATKKAPPAVLTLLKSGLDSLPESWTKALDPLDSPSRVALAKLIASEGSPPPRAPIIDEETGEPIPRAIIVDDHELQTLARDRHFGTLIRHPRLTEFLNDPKIQNALDSLKN